MDRKAPMILCVALVTAGCAAPAESAKTLFPFDPGLPRYPDNAAMDARTAYFSDRVGAVLALEAPTGAEQARAELEDIDAGLRSVLDDWRAGMPSWALERYWSLSFSAHIYNLTDDFEAPTDDEVRIACARVFGELRRLEEVRHDLPLVAAVQYATARRVLGGLDREAGGMSAVLRLAEAATYLTDARVAMTQETWPRLEVTPECATAALAIARETVGSAAPRERDEALASFNFARNALHTAEMWSNESRSDAVLEASLGSLMHHVRWTTQDRLTPIDNATFQARWDEALAFTDTEPEVADYIYLARSWHSTWASKHFPSVPEMPGEIQGYLASEAPLLLGAMSRARDLAAAGEGAACTAPLVSLMDDLGLTPVSAR